VKVLVKAPEAIPINDEAIIIWPVEEMGRNSVTPSIMASIMASIKLIVSEPYLE
jgi:hypothetical protein